MTDEEKAEILKSTEKLWNERNRLKELEKENAELKAQIPQWHDLRKNPDDLPEHSGLYCVQCGEVREYVKEEKSWFTVNFFPCMNRTKETYLWCELPKFEE